MRPTGSPVLLILTPQADDALTQRRPADAGAAPAPGARHAHLLEASERPVEQGAARCASRRGRARSRRRAELRHRDLVRRVAPARRRVGPRQVALGGAVAPARRGVAGQRAVGHRHAEQVAVAAALQRQRGMPARLGAAPERRCRPSASQPWLSERNRPLSRGSSQAVTSTMVCSRARLAAQHPVAHRRSMARAIDSCVQAARGLGDAAGLRRRPRAHRPSGPATAAPRCARPWMVAPISCVDAVDAGLAPRRSRRAPRANWPRSPST